MSIFPAVFAGCSGRVHNHVLYFAEAAHINKNTDN